jgi:mRNA-degrading endonuclease RelE of RelBE toxin-antitoxin system
MMYTVVITRRALRDLGNLGKEMQDRIAKKTQRIR